MQTVDMNGAWIEKVHDRHPPKMIVLDMDSSVLERCSLHRRPPLAVLQHDRGDHGDVRRRAGTGRVFVARSRSRRIGVDAPSSADSKLVTRRIRSNAKGRLLGRPFCVGTRGNIDGMRFGADIADAPKLYRC